MAGVKKIPRTTPGPRVTRRRNVSVEPLTHLLAAAPVKHFVFPTAIRARMMQKIPVGGQSTDPPVMLS